MRNSKSYSFFATAPLGMENLLREELQGQGMACLSELNQKGGVSFSGSLEDGYRVCLWSRFASRVLLELSRFEALDPLQLYEGAKKIVWSQHLTPQHTFAVDCVSSQSHLSHTHYGALKIKDAIVDQFRETHSNLRPSVSLSRPDVRIYAYLHRNEVRLSLDLSGESLHRRGYRHTGAEAPLKENLAAALIRSTGWPDSFPIPCLPTQAESFCLLDPMCGSGTLLIEAAGMLTQMAPGFSRDYYGFLGWLGHQPWVWMGTLQ